jgi:hypothetical protein
MRPADGKKSAQAPDVMIAAQPAELVVTNGKPALQPVKGVNLLSVPNADRPARRLSRITCRGVTETSH